MPRSKSRVQIPSPASLNDERGTMNDESFYIHRSALLIHPFLRRRSQVVRQRSAKPLFVGSIPTAAFNVFNKLVVVCSSSKKSTVVGIVVDVFYFPISLARPTQIAALSASPETDAPR